jgi:hypothetical protein
MPHAISAQAGWIISPRLGVNVPHEEVRLAAAITGDPAVLLDDEELLLSIDPHRSRLVEVLDLQDHLGRITLRERVDDAVLLHR